MSEAKVLLICLDSMEPDLVDEWMASGALPNLARVRAQAAYGRPEVPTAFGNGVLWPTLNSGVNLGKHGRYFAFQLRYKTYDDYEFEDDTDIKYNPFWHAASEQGKRVAVIDAIRAPFRPPLNGIQLTDWFTHVKARMTRSWPQELAGEVTQRYGETNFDNSDMIEPTLEGYRQLRDQLLYRIRAKGKMAPDYYRKDDYDLFVVAFNEPHDVGHTAWAFNDPLHPAHRPDWNEQIGNIFKEIYVAIDEAVGKLLAQVSDDTSVFIFTGPGMGPDYSANALLDEVLRRLQYGPSDQVAPRKSLRSRLTAIYKGVLPQSVRVAIRKTKYWGRVIEANNNFLNQERAHRQAFALKHNEGSGAVRVNLAGREPNGQIQPGADYEAYCDQLTADLMEIINLDTGRPIVERVVRTADHYHGPYVDELPDLMVCWHRDHEIVNVASPKIGKVTFKEKGVRTGDHTPRSLLMIRSPRVKPDPLPAMRVEDVAPTIARMMGVTLPDDVDGVALQDTAPHVFAGLVKVSV